MKNLKILVAVCFLSMLTSCGTIKETTTSTETTTVQDNKRGRSNQVNTEGRTKTTNSPQMTSEKIEVKEDVRVAEAREKARLQEMYSALDMDEVQISRFESEWGRAAGNWKRSNRNASMNTFERVEYQDRILKNILDEAQFETYQEWARENPIPD